MPQFTHTINQAPDLFQLSNHAHRDGAAPAAARGLVEMKAVLVLATLLPSVLGARYQLCNFTCAKSEQSWVACRSEKCTPRLPEDACANGDEAELLPAFGESAPPKGTVLTDGFAVAGPQECEALVAKSSSAEATAGDPLPLPVGSFQERCDLCMGVVVEVLNIVRLALSEGDRMAVASKGAAATCEKAIARVEATLPSVRTCRMHPPACASVLALTREQACPPTYEQLLASSSASGVRTASQALCGQLMTQRNGSGVDDALVCPVPRDVGERIMAISAVVATCLFLVQVVVPRYFKV